MGAIVKTETVGAWSLGFASADDEPRIRDLDLAERLGFAHPRRIRSLVERLEKGPSFGLCTTVVQSRGGRPGVERWLTEAQTLKVIARSETPKAGHVALLTRRECLALEAKRREEAEQLSLGWH